MRLIVFALVVATVCAKTHFSEDFSGELDWIKSTAKGEEAGDLVKVDGGVKTSTDARFYQYVKAFPEFSSEDSTLVFQFSVKHGQGIDCGGGYFKLLPPTTPADETFNGDSEYAIMFGPDVCGSTKRCHFIVNYKGTNHLIEKDITIKKDKRTHVYTLILKPSDQTFQVLIDSEVVREGNLLEEFSFLPPKEIDDPDAKKPADWVDEEYLDDPEDVKPEGYDDIPAEIPDPEAEQPEDWDSALDGEWAAPMVSNPDYKGPWSPKKIKNEAYKGPWEPPKVENPEYAPAAKDASSIGKFKLSAVALDVWQVKSGSVIGNILITDSEDDAEDAATEILKVQAKEKAQEEKEAAEAAKKAEAEAAAAAEEGEDEDDEDERDEL